METCKRKIRKRKLFNSLYVPLDRFLSQCSPPFFIKCEIHTTGVGPMPINYVPVAGTRREHHQYIDLDLSMMLPKIRDWIWNLRKGS